LYHERESGTSVIVPPAWAEISFQSIDDVVFREKNGESPRGPEASREGHAENVPSESPLA
jgi:hypothetical protein